MSQLYWNGIFTCLSQQLKLKETIMLPNQEPSFPYVARLAFGLICITILVYWMYVQDAQEKVENKARRRS